MTKPVPLHTHARSRPLPPWSTTEGVWPQALHGPRRCHSPSPRRSRQPRWGHTAARPLSKTDKAGAQSAAGGGGGSPLPSGKAMGAPPSSRAWGGAPGLAQGNSRPKLQYPRLVGEEKGGTVQTPVAEQGQRASKHRAPSTGLLSLLPGFLELSEARGGLTRSQPLGPTCHNLLEVAFAEDRATRVRGVVHNQASCLVIHQ